MDQNFELDEIENEIVVVGMDPASFRNCGWGVVRLKNNVPELLLKHTFVMTRDEKDLTRLKDMYDFFQEIINKYNPKVLCVERSMGGGLAFVRNNLSENVGVIKLCCHNNGILVHETSPAHWKLLVTGYGRATKVDVQKNVKATFKIDDKGIEHEYDAVACALSYLIDKGWKNYVVKVPCTKLIKKVQKGKKKK